MMALGWSLADMVAGLSDDELQRMLQCEERCALRGFRVRRHVAMERVCCLKREAERRGLTPSTHIGDVQSSTILPFRRPEGDWTNSSGTPPVTDA